MSTNWGGNHARRETERVFEIATEPLPEVAISRCTGCGRCVSACPARLFTLEVSGFRKYAALSEPARCSRCYACLAACPVGALCAIANQECS